MRQVPKSAAKYSSPPQAIPTAADNQTEAAVVRPWTTIWSSPVFLKMRPAPKNPTPEGMAAEIREASQSIGPLRKAKAELIVKRQLPRDTNDMVRIPAGRSACRRSHPINPPITMDNTSLRPNEHSVGVKKSKKGCRICGH